MSVSGLCQVCENARAQFTCSQCGAAVCEAHYERSAGICADCTAGQRM